MRENRWKFISGMSIAGLLLLTSTAFAQKPASPAPATAKTTTAAAQPAPVVADGRIVKIDSGSARLSADAVKHVQNAFNRRLPRDLRTYTLAEVISAAEAAVAEGSGSPTARPRICVTISCCPLRITIRWPCSGVD